VSSAGMDRPLRHEKQFIKNTGRVLSFLKNDGKLIEGKLIRYDESQFVISAERKVKNDKNKNVLVVEEMAIPRNELKEIKRVISFK